ncbi:MAG: YfhO family protein, partial [Planctomycetes bacterium]|nr:YfhO family protein [Planctomycetota bacterium]
MTKPRLIVLLVVAGLFAWCFGDALFGGGVFVFRDAGHYYYPLFQFIKSEWAAGRVPLWNPYENLGVPLAANATSSVFYPGTLLLLLPLKYALAYNLYVMGHVLLAAWAAYRLARHLGGSVEASGAGAISYAFSGNVLFQYANVVFLVGAAWLPLAVLAADRMLREGPGAGGRGPGKRARWAVWFGCVLALMVLGGNAEMAYHAGLIAAMYAAWLWWWERGRAADDTAQERGPGRRSLPGRLFLGRPALLAVAAVVGFVLSAVQVFPAVGLSRRSGRGATAVARNVYELPGHWSSGSSGSGVGWSDGLTCRRLPRAAHHEHVYHFSVGPWRLGEYVWPNAGGRQFPVHRRWLDAVPGEGRLWTPSLYMGLLPLVLALAAWRLRGEDARQSWLSWVVLLSVVGSLGWYGLGWVAHEIRIAAGANPSGPWLVGAPFGGLYWLMSVLLPGYIYFRYPAKLLVIAALGLSMLAVRGWDGVFTRPSPRTERGLLGLGGVSLAGAVVMLGMFPFRDRWLAGVGPNVMFGPLDKTGAAVDLFCAFLTAAVVCGVGWWLVRRAAGGARWPQAAALVVVAVDLALANGWLVACAPADSWRGESKLAAVLEAEQTRRGHHQPYRVFRHPIWVPPRWSEAASTDRLVEAVRWDRHTLWPKHNLAAGIAMAEVQGTMKPYDYQVLLWVAKRNSSHAGGLLLPAWAEMDPVGAKYLILRGRDRMPDMEPVELDGTAAEGLEDVSLWHNPHHLPRAWIVHRVAVLPAVGCQDPLAVWRRTEEALYPAGQPRNLRESAVVEGAVEFDQDLGDTAEE